MESLPSADARLDANENPFGASPLAAAAAVRATESAGLYPAATDIELCEALAGYHGRGLRSDHFFSANGGVEALSLIEDALLEPGAEALICPPCFGPYRNSLRSKRADIVEVHLSGDAFGLDPRAVLRAVTSRTRLVYLCNPNNPTGTFFGADLLDTVVQGLPAEATLVYDEVYYQFATEFELPDALRYVLEQRNFVIVHSFSKAYGLAGLRVGYGIAAPHLVNRIRARKRTYHLNAVGMAAAIAAIGDEEHVRKTVENNTLERARVARELTGSGLLVAPSQANFVLFRCPSGWQAGSLARALAERGVRVRPAFDLPEHIRMTIGLPDDNSRFLTALADLLLETRS